MTPLDVSDGIAAYLMDELRKLNEPVMLPRALFEYGAGSYQEWIRMKTSASYAQP